MGVDDGIPAAVGNVAVAVAVVVADVAVVGNIVVVADVAVAGNVAVVDAVAAAGVGKDAGKAVGRVAEVSCLQLRSRTSAAPGGVAPGELVFGTATQTSGVARRVDSAGPWKRVDRG